MKDLPIRRPLSSLAAVTMLTLGCSGTQTATAQEAPAMDECPMGHGSAPAGELHHYERSILEARSNLEWWPNQVDLSPLRRNEITQSNPLGDEYDYAEAFESLDLDALRADIRELMRTSQDWWPADWGHYGPLFIRMAWHSAGTYRTFDGRGGAGGGQQRFEPLNSWPDNGNLDRARRLLWPIKQEYGDAISWADLMVLAGTVAMDDMGFETLGFAGGRADDWQAEMVYWGPEAQMLADERYSGDRDLQRPLAAVQMGLIYVNPEGPNGNPDPLLAAQDIRDVFGRMAMDDEETVALIAGGHTFGKTHGAHNPGDCTGPEPAAEGVEAQGLGWNNRCGTGNGADTVTSGLEGAWTATPTQWSMQYLTFLFRFDWVQSESPAGAIQWIPENADEAMIVPDAHTEGEMDTPVMLTTDLALRYDPIYAEISQRFLENPEEFEAAFARAWFKLTHRDMGPRSRYLGDAVPDEVFIWQDPVPDVDHPLVDADDIAGLKADILESGLTVPQLVRTAWAAAASFRDTDMRGGANGGRLALEPQNTWDVNDTAELEEVLSTLEEIREEFNDDSDGAQISLADMIVLGGAAAIEQAASEAGYEIEVPFAPGRTDATQEMTDVDSFRFLEPTADAFRNYYDADRNPLSPVEMMIDKAATLSLTVPEMTALVGGMRAMGANAGGSEHGLFTERPGVLSNDWFANLLAHGTTWSTTDTEYVFEGRDASGDLVWTATEADLVFGSNAELRAVAEVYAYADERFVDDFVDAWVKVMRLDRFDLD